MENIDKHKETVAEDMLMGADEIAAFLGISTAQVYHAARLKTLPIGRYGSRLIASKRKLQRAFADLTSGLWVAIAILSGLQGRAAENRGCHIDFSMLDGQIALLTLAAARYFALGEVPPRLGTEHPGRVPSASFLCADGGYLHITASDQHWLPLCRALGLEDWGSETELQSNGGRLRRRIDRPGAACRLTWRRSHRAA